MAKQNPPAKAAAETAGVYYAKDSLTYMPIGAKEKFKLGDAEYNSGFAKRHNYVPRVVADLVTGKPVRAKKPGTEDPITDEEYYAANKITDMDPEHVDDFLKRDLLVRASDVVIKKLPKSQAGADLEAELVEETDAL